VLILLLRATTDTLTNKTLTTPTITSIASTSGLLTLPAGADTLIGRATTDTLTNKTLTSATLVSPLITNLSLSGSTLLGCYFDKLINTGTLTLPTISDTLVTKTTTDTLTNKTLTAPTITSLYGGGGLLSMPSGVDTLVGRATTDTFTATKSFWGGNVFGCAGTVYQTGTVSRSGSTITGSGTTFTQAMVGGILRFSTSGEICFITAFTSTTVLTCDVSGTVASQSFAIRYNMFCTDVGGQRLGMPATVFNQGYAISSPTISANDQFVLKSATQVLTNKNFDSTNVFSLNTDNTRTVTIIPLNANSTNCNLWFNSTVGRTYFFGDPGADASVIMSEGNQTINGVKTFGTSWKVPSSGGASNEFNYYGEAETQSNTVSGSWTSQSITFIFNRVGKTVTVSWGSVFVASTSSTSTQTVGTAFPTRFRPTQTNTVAVPVYQNSVIEPGFFTLFTDGSCNFQICSFSAPFTGTCGITAGTATYRV
jgi:hypothetical protein